MSRLNHQQLRKEKGKPSLMRATVCGLLCLCLLCVRVWLVVGSQDPVAPPELSQDYAEALRNHRGNVSVRVLPGLEHDILLEPATFDALKALLQTLKKDPQR
jgi:pimeloyl-ACP methyl ester carboxylesterase